MQHAPYASRPKTLTLNPELHPYTRHPVKLIGRCFWVTTSRASQGSTSPFFEGKWLGLGVHSYKFRAKGSGAGFMAQMGWSGGGVRLNRSLGDSLYCYAWLSIPATH